MGRIGYRELNYGAAPDGKPLDPAVAFLESATGTTEFEAEPFDLIGEMPKFAWPTVVISGGRDLITPPAVARRIASLIPGAVLVNLATAGHSAHRPSRARGAGDRQGHLRRNELEACPHAPRSWTRRRAASGSGC